MAKRESPNRIRNGKIRRDFKRLLAIIADVREPDYAEAEEIARRSGVNDI